jgi:GNAT superfamily N-acetyltransferase
MTRSYPLLPSGFSVVPPGKLASAVTCLEMLKPPTGVGAIDAPGLVLARFDGDDLAGYRRLFRSIGEDWLWSSRLAKSDDALRAVTHDPSVEIYVLSDGADEIGLLELDFREPGACEVIFLGVIKEAIGKGAGRFLIENAISIAWSRPIRRFWLHTCHLDHPDALAFYQSFGFKPCALWVEVFDDPRLTGVLPRTVAPHVPLLERDED